MKRKRKLSPVVVHGPASSDHSLESTVLSHKLQVIGGPGAVASLSGKDVVCSLAGNAIYGRTALTTSESLARILEAAGDVESLIDSWGSRIKNPCAGIIVDETAQTIHILPDPLGGCIVFHGQFGQNTFASADLVSLITVVEAFGHRPQKSLTYQLERSVLGNGGLTHSSYDGVSALPVMEYASIDANGFRTCAYRVKQEYLVPATSYWSVMDAYRQDVLDSIEAISGIGDTSIAHLTGGFDSRLVLAGIMHANKQDEFAYFCSGPTGTADRDTADGLAATLGLVRTHEAALSSDKPASVEDKFRSPMMNSAGLTNSGPLGTESYNGRVVVGGGYGETLRSFYSSLAGEQISQTSIEGIAEKFWGAHALDTKGLITESSREGVLERLSQALNELKEDGYEDDYLGDAFYINFRNRYHIGQNSMLWSRVGRRFDPLYSIHAPRLARMLPLQERKTNVAGFDLMAAMYPELLAYPFDRPRFSEDYAKSRRIPVTKTFLGTKPRFKTSPTVAKPISGGSVDPELRKKHIAQSVKMGVNFWQIQSMEATQKGLRGLLREMTASELSQAVNPDYVHTLSTATLRNRSQVRHLYAVYSMMLWYAAP